MITMTYEEGFKELMRTIRMHECTPVFFQIARRIEDLVNGVDPNPREAEEFEAERQNPPRYHRCGNCGRRTLAGGSCPVAPGRHG